MYVSGKKKRGGWGKGDGTTGLRFIRNKHWANTASIFAVTVQGQQNAPGTQRAHGPKAAESWYCAIALQKWDGKLFWKRRSGQQRSESAERMSREGCQKAIGTPLMLKTPTFMSLVLFAPRSLLSDSHRMYCGLFLGSCLERTSTLSRKKNNNKESWMCLRE